jgi:hypothetical protein
MEVLLFAFYVLAAGGKDDSPLRRSLASSRALQAQTQPAVRTFGPRFLRNAMKEKFY